MDHATIFPVSQFSLSCDYRQEFPTDIPTQSTAGWT